MEKLKEQWLQVPGYERYLVSNTGRVISTLKNRTKELKAQQDGIGYLHYRLYPEDKRHGLYANNRGVRPKLFKAHRLVAETFIPNGDTKLQINHKDADKHNNVITNLEWCTAQQNIQHSWDFGLRTDTHGKIAKRNRKPLVAIHLDGSKIYFQSRLHLSFGLECSRPLVSMKLKSGAVVERGNAKGYTFTTISELPEGETFQEVPNYHELATAFNEKYFYKHLRKRKQIKNVI
mgnify:CR=1 FL=1